MPAAAKNTSAWGERKIESGADVTEALTHLQLPTLSEDALRLVAGSDEKGRFKTALQKCVGSDADVDTKRYLTGLVRCLSSVVAQMLGELGYHEVPIEALFHIGKTNGMSFRNALAAAMDKNLPNSEQSAEFVAHALREALEHIGAPVKANTPAPRPQPQGNSRAPAQSASAPSTHDEHEAPTSSQDETDKDTFLSTHVYGGKASLCFNAATAQNGGHFTVIVDGANAIGERKYDWKNAVKIQLGHKELPLLYGVLVGWRDSIKFDAHGVAHDKTFELIRQDGKFFAKVMGKSNGKAVAPSVPVGPMDAYPIMMVVLTQIIKEAPKELQPFPALIIQMMREAQNIKPVPQ